MLVRNLELVPIDSLSIDAFRAIDFNTIKVGRQTWIQPCYICLGFKHILAIDNTIRVECAHY